MQGLTRSKQQRLRTLIARGIDQGWSDTKMEEAIRSVVGLDDRYARAVEAYRTGLIAQGHPAGKARQAANQYAARLLRSRAQRIARTEVQKALLDAQRLMWTQQQEDGDLSRYAVRVIRLHKDERLCKVCRPLNGRRVSLRSGAGVEVQGVLFPGPPFHPNCRCYEEVSDQGIAKTDPDLVACRCCRGSGEHASGHECYRCDASGQEKGASGHCDEVTLSKHLPGLHNQKTHGRTTGLRQDISDHLKRAVEQHGAESLVGQFALGILDLGKQYPRLAEHVRGVDLDWDGAYEDPDSPPKGHIAEMVPTRNGHLIKFNPEAAALDLEKMEQGRRIGVPHHVQVERYAYAVAVHEWGHIAHRHMVIAASGKVQHDIAHRREDRGDWMEDIPVITTYAEQNPPEQYAEWFTAMHLRLLKPEVEAQSEASRQRLKMALTQPIVMDYHWAQVQKGHHPHSTFVGSVVEQFVAVGDAASTLSDEFRHKHLMRRPA